MHLRFLDVMDHLWNHPSSMHGTETTTLLTPTSQDSLKRSILSELGEVVMSIFGGGNSGTYSQATIEKINRNFHILQQNQNFQSRWIQDQFALIDLTRVE